MRVIKTKHFPFNGYKAINLFGIIFTKGELSNKELNHRQEPIMVMLALPR